MFVFKSMKLEMVAVSLVVSFITTAFLGGIFLSYIVNENNRQLREYKKDLQELADVRMVNETRVAVSVLREFHGRQQAGLLSETEAKKEAADIVRALRYDNGEGYFWIDTEEGVNVVLLGSEAEGKPRLHVTDPTGKEFVADLIEKSRREGAGFTNFMFPKPGKKEASPKRAYSAYFKPWGWVLGTGIWTDHIERLVEIRQDILSKRLKDNLFGVGLTLFVLMGLFVFMSVYIGAGMARPILAVAEALRKMGTGNLGLDEATKEQMRQVVLRPDELGIMGRAMQEMRDRLSEYQSAILNMAHKDALTGLANRRYLQEYIASLEDCQNFIVIALDLDHFKEVNDTAGHQAGDAALQILAERLNTVFHDGFNVRTGGDEFLVVLTGERTLSEAEARLETFMEQLVATYRGDPGLERLTVSAGIACSFGQNVPVGILMRQSDRALYQAKEAGRSCYRVYHESMASADDALQK